MRANFLKDLSNNSLYRFAVIIARYVDVLVALWSKRPSTQKVNSMITEFCFKSFTINIFL